MTLLQEALQVYVELDTTDKPNLHPTQNSLDATMSNILWQFAYRNQLISPSLYVYTVRRYLQHTVPLHLAPQSSALVPQYA
jgi:hypothetical protein